MSRVTAPVTKLSRAISSAPSVRTSSTPAQNAGAVLMPKYAELLRNRRSSEHSDSSRGLTTTHRPTPQPSIANRNKPLMQTFSSSSAPSAAASSIDGAVLPFLGASEVAFDSFPRMPLLPDSFANAHAPTSDAGAVPRATIFAANPENVVAGAPLTEIEGLTLDGVELKFVHEHGAGQQEETGGGMIRDLWKGMVEDVLGPARKAI